MKPNTSELPIFKAAKDHHTGFRGAAQASDDDDANDLERLIDSIRSLDIHYWPLYPLDLAIFLQLTS